MWLQPPGFCSSAHQFTEQVSGSAIVRRQLKSQLEGLLFNLQRRDKIISMESDPLILSARSISSRGCQMTGLLIQTFNDVISVLARVSTSMITSSRWLTIDSSAWVIASRNTIKWM
jgi:hypothetical protein